MNKTRGYNIYEYNSRLIFQKGLIMKPKTIIIIVLVILLTILSMQNTQPVIFKILLWEPDFPLIILIFIAIGIGFIAGYIANSVLQVVKKKDDEY